MRMIVHGKRTRCRRLDSAWGLLHVHLSLSLLSHRVFVQRFVQLVDDGGPRGVGLDLFGQELPLRLVPVGCIGERDSACN